MPTIFKRIRRGLILYSQTRKYLIYAIGEIALVVIGILIALQINNWNSAIADEEILQDHLIKISESVGKDLLQIEDLMEARSESIRTTSAALEVYESKRIVSLDSFYTAITNIIYEKEFHPNLSSYNSLISSGFMRKLPLGEITDKLYEYYEIVEHIRFIEQKENNFTEEMEISLFQDGFFEIVFSTISRAALNDRELFEQVSNYPACRGLLIRNSVTMAYLIGHYINLQTKGDEVISEIKKRTKV